ncbi:unnamed protein product [Ilex paraguariensis]|uniref:Inner centromere protein ARK-binding domain-containing protein n=1 Tax=Ilex paraguariensis TaxID=185542 RepID=A0ABC8RQZ7_9AQUA
MSLGALWRHYSVRVDDVYAVKLQPDYVDGQGFVKMTTVEKLFVQIFERKNRIIQQVKQQTDLYNQHLASKCLIDGITPPSWLWNPNFHSQASDPKGALLQPDYVDGQGFVKMTTVEKLFVQIFERKNRIIQQVKQQTDLYNQHLASKCLIDGITPPSWLWNPNFHSQASDPKELKKEDLISELLLPHLQPTVTSFSSHCYLYGKPIVTGDNEELSRMETQAFHRDLNAEDGPSTMSECHENNMECALNTVPEIDVSVTSPQNQAELSISNTYTAQDQSLARIQRSRSRQKALELRNSAKNVAKSLLRHENNTNVSCEMTLPRIASQQTDHIDELGQLARNSDVGSGSCSVREAEERVCLNNEKDTSIYCGRITRSRSSCRERSCGNDAMSLDISSDNVKKDSGTLERSTVNSLQHCNSVNELLEVVNPFDVTTEDCIVRKAITGVCRDKEESGNVYGSRITRSRTSSQPPSCLNESSRLDVTTCSAKADGNMLAQLNSKSICHLDDDNNLQKLAQPSGEFSGRRTRSQTTLNEGISTSIKTSSILNPGAQSSKSGAANISLLANLLNRAEGYELQNLSGGQVIIPCPETQVVADQEGIAETVIGIELVSDDIVEDLSISRSNLDGANQSTGLEGLVTRPAPDCCMFVKPKQLDFDDMEVHSLNETFGPNFENSMLGKSSEKMCWLLSETVASVDRETSDDLNGKTWEKHSLVKPTISREPEDVWRGSFDAVVEGAVQMKKSGTTMSEDSMPKSIRDNSEAIQHIQNSPVCHDTDVALSNVNKSFDVEGNQVKSLSTERFKSSRELRIEEGERGYEGMDRSATASYFFRGNHLEAPEVSSLTKHATGDFQDCSDEEVGTADLTCAFIDANSQCCVQDNQNLLHLDNVLYSRNTGNLACSIKSPDVKTSHQREDGLLTYGSVGAPHCEDENLSLNIREIQLEKKSSSPDTSFSSAKLGSWPQLKRRKIEDQLTNSFSASPSFRVQKLYGVQGDPTSRCMQSVENNSEIVLKFEDFPVSCDASQTNVNKSSAVGMCQKLKCESTEGVESLFEFQSEEVELNSKERDKIAEIPLAFTHELLGSSLVSSLNERAALGSENCLVQEVGMSDPISTVLDARKHSKKHSDQLLLHLANKVNQINGEDLTCIERSQRERKFHLGEDGLPSYCAVQSPHNIDTDQTLPVFEGFIIDPQTEDEEPGIAEDRINFDKLDLPSSTIERASILEQICKSTSRHTPLPHFSSTFQFQRTKDLHQSVPNGILEHMESRSTLLLCDDVGKQLWASYGCMDEVNTLRGVSYSDCIPYSGAQIGWNSKNPCTSPVGKLWENISSNSGSSEKRLSSNPELICFPIEEDSKLICFPIEEDSSMSEETENADEVANNTQEGVNSTVMNPSAKREPLADVTKACSNLPPLVCEAGKFPGRGSVDSVNTEVSITGAHNKVKQKLHNRYSNKRRGTNEAKENQALSMGANDVKRPNVSLHNRFSKPKLSSKTSLKKGGVKRLSEKEHKHNNIVSSITSFIPLVQQKKADAVCAGKRDIKVKSLEAAEAAKRLEERKQNERKTKKEELKLERARLQQDNLRQMELNKRKKEEEQKKKEADAAARKRVRDEEEQKERERKRKRIETRRHQRDQVEQLCGGKVEKERHCSTVDEKRDQKMENEREDVLKNPETRARTGVILASDVQQGGSACKDCDASIDSRGNGKEMSMLDKSTKNDLVTKTSPEKSYEISPYHCSDDEEAEEEDDVPSKKFTPPWASKNRVALVISSQQKIDPDVIFPLESFCSMDEVLLPRKLQQK